MLHPRERPGRFDSHTNRRPVQVGQRHLIQFDDLDRRWVSTGLNRAIHSNVANIATMEAGAQQARGVYPQVTKAALAFSAACKPK